MEFVSISQSFLLSIATDLDGIQAIRQGTRWYTLLSQIADLRLDPADYSFCIHIF